MGAVLVTGAFDDLGLRHVRLLHEASRIGPVVVQLWSDKAILNATGAEPKFLLAERRYLAESLRWVSQVALPGDPHPKIDMVCVDVEGPGGAVRLTGRRGVPPRGSPGVHGTRPIRRSRASASPPRTPPGAGSLSPAATTGCTQATYAFSRKWPVMASCTWWWGTTPTCGC